MDKKIKIHTEKTTKTYKFVSSSSKIRVYYDDGSFFGNWVEIGSSSSEADCLTIAQNHASQFGKVKRVEY
jgi:hypothetical protein